jgi:hypothetical protein
LLGVERVIRRERQGEAQSERDNGELYFGSHNLSRYCRISVRGAARAGVR